MEPLRLIVYATSTRPTNAPCNGADARRGPLSPPGGSPLTIAWA